MGFDSIVRSGVKLADSLTKSLQATVLLHRWRGVLDDGSKPDYAPAITLEAVVDYRPRRFMNAAQEQVDVVATATIPAALPALGAEDRDEPIDTRDKVTTPDGRQLSVVGVRGVTDPVTKLPYAVELGLGA